MADAPVASGGEATTREPSAALSSTSGAAAVSDAAREWSSEALQSALSYDYILYPTDKLPLLEAGRHVHVRPDSYGHAVVLAPLITEKGHRFEGRVPVRYSSDGSEFHANPKRITPKYGTAGQRQVLMCYSTEFYRRLAHNQPNQDDFVVELGSSYGKASNILAPTCGKLLAVDCSKEAVEQSQELYPHIDFRRIDVFTDRLQLLEAARGCTVVFLDIGGNRELQSVSHMLCFLLRALQPRLVVVKSQELHKHAAAHTASVGGTGELGALRDKNVWWGHLTDLVVQSEMQLRVLEVKPRPQHLEGGGGRFSRHPLKYPPRTTADGVLICRFHNYRECLRFGARAFVPCPHDHDHCNHCGEAGHTAQACTAMLNG